MIRNAFFSVERVLGLGFRRPSLELQIDANDCGYACVSAICKLLGSEIPIDVVKQEIGTTSRGLTVRQVRDGLRKLGVDADAVKYDVANLRGIPCPGIVLLKRGHFLVIRRQVGNHFEIFDPGFGWLWQRSQKLYRESSGFGIAIYPSAQPVSRVALDSQFSISKYALSILSKIGAARAALVIFAIGQLTALALPILSKISVDASIQNLSFSILGNIAVGFLALSLTNVIILLFGDMLHNRTKRMAAFRLSKSVSASLSRKTALWFDSTSAPTIHNRISSATNILDFFLDSIRAAGTLLSTFIVGVIALFYISPWLVIPSLISLILTIILDLFVESAQRNQVTSSVEASQAKHAFILEVFPQIPAARRFDAQSQIARRYSMLVRRSALAESIIQTLRGWRQALTAILRSAESLIFVTLAAYLMGEGGFSVGTFVAVGAYKDLLASALSNSFQLYMRHSGFAIHRAQAEALFSYKFDEQIRERHIESGVLELRNVSFSYGTIDPPVLKNVSLTVQSGECIFIKGPSGIGKSTMAKLIVGSLRPTEGKVLLDGDEPTQIMSGVAAVLQNDKLFSGTIRDNVRMYRNRVTDDMIWRALHDVQLEEFVKGLPMKLNTLVSDAGGGLSGGQRQRLLLARAIVLDFSLIVLDEATSSLDVETERHVIGKIAERKATSIIISHRPEVWSLGGRVFELDPGGKFQEIV